MTPITIPHNPIIVPGNVVKIHPLEIKQEEQKISLPIGSEVIEYKNGCLLIESDPFQKILKQRRFIFYKFGDLIPVPRHLRKYLGYGYSSIGPSIVDPLAAEEYFGCYELL